MRISKYEENDCKGERSVQSKSSLWTGTRVGLVPAQKAQGPILRGRLQKILQSTTTTTISDRQKPLVAKMRFFLDHLGRLITKT